MRPKTILLLLSVIAVASVAFTCSDGGSERNTTPNWLTIENLLTENGSAPDGMLHFAIMPVNEFSVFLPVVQNPNPGLQAYGWECDKRQRIMQTCRSNC